MRTTAQRSELGPHISQWQRSPARDCEGTFSSLATEARPAPCISRPSTGQPQAKHQQFAMDARCSPLRVLAAHPSDQITQAPIDLGPPCPLPRFPAPERHETCTMPAKDGLRLNSDAELMAEEQVLGFKPARRLEEVNDEHCERRQEREHRSRSCDDSTRRCDSQAGWDFRKGHRDPAISLSCRPTSGIA